MSKLEFDISGEFQQFCNRWFICCIYWVVRWTGIIQLPCRGITGGICYICRTHFVD